MNVDQLPPEVLAVLGVIAWAAYGIVRWHEHRAERYPLVRPLPWNAADAAGSNEPANVDAPREDGRLDSRTSGRDRARICDRRRGGGHDSCEHSGAVRVSWWSVIPWEQLQPVDERRWP